MSLKLIRKAQIATTTSKDILVAEHVREVLSKIRVQESLSPDTDITKADYDRWMHVVADVAKDSGMTVTKKTQLADIVMDVLDNDPKIESQPGDKEVLKSKIVDTMWNAYGATFGHASVKAHVAKAREEEEQSGFGQAFKASQGVEDEQRSAPLVKAALGNSITNPYRPGTLRASLWDQLHSAEENEEFGDDKAPAPRDNEGMDDQTSVEDRSSTDDDMDDGGKDITLDKGGYNDDDSIEGEDEIDPDAELENDDDIDKDPEDLLSDLSTDELEAELARRKGEDGDDQDAPDENVDVDVDVDSGNDVDVDVDRDDEAEGSDEPKAGARAEEPVDDIAKRVFSDEESTKNFFRTVVTKPQEHIKAALATIGKEAEGAWHEVKLPKNPHPKQSAAFREWEKSFRNIAKAALGIKDPKPSFTSKQRKKR